ncbi:MAG TPA: hypothetical protein V6D08_00280 [Candidatus Obscuribacterales bacterium]
MAARRRVTPAVASAEEQRAWLEALSNAEPIAGVPGPGQWLVLQYQPTTLFSLKISLATSSVGKTLVVPTPYSIKMAFVDAAFRADLTDNEVSDFFQSLVGIDVRIAPPPDSVVTHTFVKIRQESRGGNILRPYISSIAYREVVHQRGRYLWAFDLSKGDTTLAERLVRIGPHVSYIGKRGSFIQFSNLERRAALGPDFTQPIRTKESWTVAERAHVVPLDDFGPEADLEILSSFSKKGAVRDKHRCFIETVVPVGVINTGPGFTQYGS